MTTTGVALPSQVTVMMSLVCSADAVERLTGTRTSTAATKAASRLRKFVFTELNALTFPKWTKKFEFNTVRYFRLDTKVWRIQTKQ